jgi:hypothetical protein
MATESEKDRYQRFETDVCEPVIKTVLALNPNSLETIDRLIAREDISKPKGHDGPTKGTTEYIRKYFRAHYGDEFVKAQSSQTQITLTSPKPQKRNYHFAQMLLEYGAGHKWFRQKYEIPKGAKLNFNTKKEKLFLKKKTWKRALSIAQWEQRKNASKSRTIKNNN